MPKDLFFGRESNISQLKKFYEVDESSFVFVKGRRRVGKSTLMRHFFAGRSGVFSFAGHEGEEDRAAKRRFAKMWDQFTGVKRLVMIRVVDLDWQSIFDEMALYIGKADQKMTIVIDEIQWLHTKGNGFAGFIKEFWEQIKGNCQLKFVISGSSTRFFNDHIIGQNATLRGLSTHAAIHVLPFTLSEVQSYYFPKWSKEEVALTYMMLGGVPYYLERIPYGQEKNFVRAINDGIFSSQSIFLEEVENIIKIELLRKTAADRIKSMLRHLGYNGKSISALHRITGEGEDYIYKTLTMLQEVGLIRKRTTAKGGGSSRVEYVYFLDDPYLNFYFSLLEPNSFKIKKNVGGLLFKEFIHSNHGYYIPQFTGGAFELLIFNFLECAMESGDYGKVKIVKKLRIHDLDYRVETSLIHQKSQIDILVASEQDREVRVIEVKWLNSKRGVEDSHFDAVIQKILPEQYSRSKARTNYLMVSCPVTEALLRTSKERDVVLLSLEDLWPG